MPEYFSHDFNARNDIKMRVLFKKYRLKGIGLYWCLVEILNENGGYILENELETIAEDLKVSMDFLENVLCNFNLFSGENGKYWSESTLKRLQIRNEKSAKATESVNKRWEKHTNVLREQNERNTLNKSKENNIKENKSKVFIPPSLLEITIYCQLRKNVVDPGRFHDHYESNGWMVGRNKMKNWKAAIHTWEKNNFNTNTNATGTAKKQSAHERNLADLHEMANQSEAFIRTVAGQNDDGSSLK